MIFGATKKLECESNDARNKTLSIKEYLDETKPHPKDIKFLKRI